MTADDDLAEITKLTTDELARLMVEVLRHHGEPMTRDEVFAAVAVLADDYADMVVSRGIWDAWRAHWVEFAVVDGEMVVHTGDDEPPAEAGR